MPWPCIKRRRAMLVAMALHTIYKLNGYSLSASRDADRRMKLCCNLASNKDFLSFGLVFDPCLAYGKLDA